MTNAKQPLKKKDIKSFSVNDFKKTLNLTTSVDKPLEWFIMPKGFQDALSLPGIPKGYFSGCYGWNSTGKSTIKNCLIAAAQRQNTLPIIFETENNFDFKYAIDCGMEAQPEERVDETTGETVVDYTGNFILFNNEIICNYCGDYDYNTGTRKATKRRVAVVEDIAFIIEDMISKQERGELPMDLLFIWDSVGSIPSIRSFESKATPSKNMYDANAISTAFGTIVNTLIPSSRSQNYPYTNTFFIVNKIWDSTMQTMGKPSVKLKGGNSFEYALRLLISCGKVITSGVKKLEAVVKGEKYEYGTMAQIAVKKNHLPSPYNISREGNLYCVGSGIIAAEEIDAYKKKILPDLIKQLQSNDQEGKFKNITEKDFEFVEEDAQLT